ncbi:hypothetical protein [Clostridium sp.]
MSYVKSCNKGDYTMEKKRTILPVGKFKTKAQKLNELVLKLLRRFI